MTMDINGDTGLTFPDGSQQSTAVIIERGSSGNSSWIKWSDGTMVCTGSASSSLSASTSTGSGYQSSSVTTFSFPVAFIETPKVSVDSVFTGGVARGWVALDTITATGCTVVAFSFVSGGVALPIYTAIGRWK